MTDRDLIPHILFIEGYCQVPWMETSYVKCPPNPSTGRGGGGGPFSAHSSFRVWCTDPSHLNEDNAPPDAYGVERCQNEIRSGRYHAIVVVDYSCPSFIDEFEDAFGDLLQAFVRDGGVVAFPSSEGLIVSTLKKFFCVEWKMSDYYRAVWEPCLEDNKENIYFSFAGNGSSVGKPPFPQAVAFSSTPLIRKSIVQFL